MTETEPTRQRTPLDVVCPDHDEDCRDMTYKEALQCYNGFPNNEHLMASGGYGPEGMGRACGQCPVLAVAN